MRTIIDASPDLVLLVGFLAVMVLGFEAGVFLGKRSARKGLKLPEGAIGGLVGALLGLLAFLLAFAFGAVVSRFDTKKELVLEEANAVESAWIRSGLLAPEYTSSVRTVLRDYVEVRLNAGTTHSMQEAVKMSEDLLHCLTVTTAELSTIEMDGEIRSMFVSSVNDLASLHRNRVVVGLVYRLPDVIWYTLIGLALLSMYVMGYQAGLIEMPRTILTVVVAFCFALVVVLIAALDRGGPDSQVAVSQYALQDVQRMMERESPE